MQDIVKLIWMTHPSALNDAITASHESPEDAVGTLLARLYTDDTFNEYTEAELQAAVAEAIAEY